MAGTIATGLSVPWGLAFLADGSALVTERNTARVLHVGRRGGGRASVVGTIPGVVHAGEGGLLGIALSPTFSRDRLVYVYFTTSADNRVARLTYRNGRLGRLDVILPGIPRGALHHDGGRLVFGPDGMLYVSTGDGYVSSRAQDLHSLGGKILRITPDGRPAPGNPFRDSPVWTYGHRNIEGLVFDPAGSLWSSEFGDREWDELNLIEKGHNYGWPYLQGKGGAPRFTDPHTVWQTESDSASGIAYADGCLWLAALKGERLWRVQISGTRVVGAPRAFFTDTYGRLRTIARAPDGSLWLTTSNTDGRAAPRPGDDRILRLTL